MTPVEVIEQLTASLRRNILYLERRERRHRQAVYDEVLESDVEAIARAIALLQEADPGQDQGSQYGPGWWLRGNHALTLEVAVPLGDVVSCSQSKDRKRGQRVSDRICLELDEYGPAGADGYGFTIEQTPDETPEGPPLVGHLRVTLLRSTSAKAHPPTNLLLARKVLTWLAHYRFPAGIDFSFFDPVLLTAVLAEQAPPGFGSPGTSDWLWYGIQVKRVECPPLRGRCTLTLCQAMPKGEDWDPRDTLEGVNILAKQCLAGDVLSHYRG